MKRLLQYLGPFRGGPSDSDGAPTARQHRPTPSMGVRLAGILLPGLALAIALIVVGVSITSQLQGGGQAINEAGKLRMQAYRIGHLLQKAADNRGQGRRHLWQQVQEDISAYDRRLAYQGEYLDQGFLASISIPRETQPTLQSIRSEWRQRKASLPSRASGLTEAHVNAYERGLEGFVGQVDTYVALLQESTATKLGRYHLSLIGFTVLGLVVGLVTFQRTRHFLTRPLQSLRDCASRIATGDLAGCRAPRAETEEIDELAAAFNHMAEELTTLKHNLDTQVAEQTRSLQQRNQRLTMLYGIATSLQTNVPVEELLDQALEGVVSVTESSAGIARLVTDDGRMRLVASRGLDPEILENEQLVPLDRCLCGHSAQAGELRFRGDLSPCELQLGTTLPCSGEGGLFAVPIKYKGQVLGLFTLFGTPRQGGPYEGIESLLETVANHVGLAIENRRLATEAQRASLMEERNLLASELHDSIAQCLASVKLQIWMLEEEVAKGDLASIRELVPKIRGGVESGYGNLRELLTHFRTKIDERGLIPALKGLVTSFQERTGTGVYLQGISHNPELGPEEEIQVFHIVQEALTNIEKHAQADNVRILVQEDPEAYHFLVEDDGTGMDVAAREADGRAHFGLSIMRERAARLNGRLEIESDPGEGTRITLSFPRPGAEGTTSAPRTEEGSHHARVSG